MGDEYLQFGDQRPCQYDALALRARKRSGPRLGELLLSQQLEQVGDAHNSLHPFVWGQFTRPAGDFGQTSQTYYTDEPASAGAAHAANADRVLSPRDGIDNSPPKGDVARPIYLTGASAVIEESP